jgi:hypothetical protein
MSYGNQPPQLRADTALKIRIDAAQAEKAKALPIHDDNGDEEKYDNKIGNYSKGLPHNEFGEVDLGAYKTLLDAVTSGQPADFEKIKLGGTVKLVNPQSGLAFDLEGADSHALRIPPSPKVDSAERAAEMVELYWMALCRDVPFAMYGQEPLSIAAIEDLNKLTDFKGPKVGGRVTAQTLFRGDTPGELAGPYISQFFLQPAPFGALAVNDTNGNLAQQYIAYKPGIDYMTQPDNWRAVQDGQATVSPPPRDQPLPLPFGPNQMLGPRCLFNGRCGSAFVHVDELYQAYFMAALNLLDNLKFDSYDINNPYNDSRTQVGFGTFGNPHVATLVAEVATRALKAVWYQKWFVHRALRPEAYGGLVHYKLTANRDYPLHPDVLGSQAVRQTFKTFGTYFLPQAFPEGCPQHPSYGSGHATVAGACATIIKAFFREEMKMPDPVVSSPDGTRLLAYTGPDADQLTLGGEANKIAGNVGMFRNHAGVHWRSDHVQSILLGEQLAISILEDQKKLYNEDFKGWTFTKFDGNKITI